MAFFCLAGKLASDPKYVDFTHNLNIEVFKSIGDIAPALKHLQVSLSFSLYAANIHCVECVQIRSYFWSVFSCIRTEYRKTQTRNNSVFGNFSRSDLFHFCVLSLPPVSHSLARYLIFNLILASIFEVCNVTQKSGFWKNTIAKMKKPETLNSMLIAC